MTVPEALDQVRATGTQPEAPLDAQPPQRYLHQERVGPQWTLTVLAAEGGSVPSVEMEATHRNGQSQRFTASLWPTGWRILRHGLTIPNNVRKAAIRIAANGTNLGHHSSRTQTTPPRTTHQTHNGTTQ